MFSTTLNHEYAVAAELLGLDRAGVAELARSRCGSRSPTRDRKRAILAEIDGYLERAR